MEDYLKTYRLQIETMSPVFVGDGTVIGNREYIYLFKNHKVIIPNQVRLYNACYRKNLLSEFEAFMTGKKVPLGRWLDDCGFTEKEIVELKQYELDAGDFFVPSRNNPGKSSPPKDIQRFIKDPYGLPYIPGSSLKGVIRTALLVHQVKSDPDAYKSALQKILSDSMEKGSRKNYLRNATEQLEQAVFHTLDRPKVKPKDAVNSTLSGLVVSDSKPLKISELTLCQKIDVAIDGRDKRLPILKEALKPGVKIEFQVSIDETICPFSMDVIQKALNEFNAVYYDIWCEKFGRGDPQPSIIWMGGGTGYVGKTVTQSLFDERRALELTDQVFKNTLGKKYFEHHHERDLPKGLSPHVYKCTSYQGKLYDVGMAKITDCIKI